MSVPLICYEFRKNAREVVRACLQEFEGHAVVDLRSYLPRADGVLVPTPRGLTLQRAHFPELERAVAAIRHTLDAEASR